VGYQAAGRARTGPAGGVPGAQRLGRLGDGLHGGGRIDQVAVLGAVGRPIQVLAQQTQPQIPGEDPGAVAKPGRIGRLSRIARLIEYGAGELTVVCPRTTVEVVAAHAGPYIVDDAHLRVYVDRVAGVVLDVEGVHPITAGAPAHLQRLGPTDVVGCPGQPPVHVGIARHDHDQMQVGPVGERAGEQVGHLTGPQVLVLQIDQPPGAPDRLGVAAGDRTFALRREVVPRAHHRVRPQQLHGVRTGR
jgi:hypothetical protein